MNLPTSFGFIAPRREAARKWIERGAVPSDWFALLLALLELERGEPISLARYIDGRGVA